MSLLSQPASAAPADHLVISEVYGGGGNTGATLKSDFIELYNPTGSDISVDGLSVQWRSATGTTAATGVTPLSGSVPAGRYYLVQEADGAGGSVDLPTPEATGTIAMGAAGGTAILARGTVAINPGTGPFAGNANVIDLVGVSSNVFETAAASGMSNTTSAARKVAGEDSDNNSADFASGAPAPQNTGWTAPPADFTGSIAEIQGTGATTPKSGAKVTTTGVVTAAYPTGGFNGFWMQTPGADTPNASDAIFVFAGSGGTFTMPAIGDHVQVVGTAGEFAGVTQITPGSAGSVSQLPPASGTVAAKDTLPGAGCAQGSCPGASELDALREASEGEVFDLAGPYTVSNAYSLTNGANGFMEIGLAADTKPLVAPTEDIVWTNTAAVAARTAYNNAHGIVLDDASSKNYTLGDSGDPMPWINKTHTVRVGAAAHFTGNVVLDFRNSIWKIQPTSQVTDLGEDTATFAQTRPAGGPREVGGDLKLGTFNVLNYFPTTGVEYEATTPNRTCRYFADRAENDVTVRDCDDTTTGTANDANGPRGAAEQEDLERQQAKIVTAINTMDADVVSLEEIENSVQFGKDRDDAVQKLVTALNTAAGSTRWAFAPSPAAADLPDLAEQDVIRTAFIYDPATVDLVGTSKVLVGSAAFGNAREPLAQAFKAEGAADSDAFGVIVNHFKSKGSGADDGTGQGNANPDRVAQAQALVTFADQFKTDRGISKMFLTGDFNAYTKEQPVKVLEDAGYTNVKSEDAGEWSYSFGGMSGSLDHVFANGAALDDVTGADLWNINAEEPIAYQYSRYNYNATDFFDGGAPFGASDHNPEIVGIDVADSNAPVDVQILGTNDFHGRLLNSSNNEAGAAVLSGAVKQLRSQKPNTVFAAAGDLIGASTFESFIQKDKPTLDALNEAGLEVSAAGNHEFDAGYDDLVNRVMKPYDAETNPYGGADWEYLAANVRKKSDHSHALPESWIKDFGNVQVGFVGAVTEDLPSLVSPDGIADIEVTDIVDESNAAADQLKADGADIVVLLVHEGAPDTSKASATSNANAFGQIVNGVDGDIDAIVSGHTHLAYNHSVEVPEWVAEGRTVTERPVVSAGQYGSFLNKLVFTWDPVAGKVTAKSQDVVPLETCTANCSSSSPTWTANFPADPAVTSIVDAAVAKANELGAQVLGKIGGPFNRAKLANGTTENRGGESTLGNLVAEVQRWATESETAGSAQIAFMNPGGLRQDMVGVGTGSFPRDLTYRQAAEVQPFANTLVNLTMTGAQIKGVLEQQWQPAGASRPFLRLGTSKGFTSTYDPSRPQGNRITGMWLDGAPIVMGQTYSVTANSFLAAGGDNFTTFGEVTAKRDTGKSDLTAMVDYMAAFTGSGTPLPVDYHQHQVGVAFPADAPASYVPGGHVKFNLSSLAYSTAADAKDGQVTVKLGELVLGSFPVDNTIGTAVFDEYGTAAVDVVLPESMPTGPATLTVVGDTTGSTVTVPITVDKRSTSVSATAEDMAYGTGGSVEVAVSPASATGQVTLLDGTREIAVATLADGSATIPVPGDALEPGAHTLTVQYAGDAAHAASSTTVDVTVAKAAAAVTASANPSAIKKKKGTSTVTVRVSASGVTPTGQVRALIGGTQVAAGALDADGVVRLVVGPFEGAGVRTIELVYGGDAHTGSGRTTTTVTVTNGNP
ncbi:ExeM/NucH family extracellular endonuclease [Nocardioides guangzhouensis]|nr:ExeM/NucH family extracellular endonuclease [Nocardioides guangzhouensis]